MTAQAKVLNPYLDHGSIRKSPVRAPLKRIPELSAERKRPSDSIDKGTPKNIVPS